MPVCDPVESFETDLVSGGVKYQIVEPHPRGPGPLPLLLALHGGNGHEGFADLLSSRLYRLWSKGEVPPCIVVVPHSGRSFWLNRHDGKANWETVLAGPFLDHCARTHDASPDPGKTLLLGISMGGMGVLRLAFRHPGRFAAVTALEPAIEPALRYKELRPENTFFRPPQVLGRLYGTPIDEAHWEANHPPAILHAQSGPIRESGLKLYLEVGNQDMLNLHQGAEFLHRQLWDFGIEHE